jgi:hypothetical protein
LLCESFKLFHVNFFFKFFVENFVFISFYRFHVFRCQYCKDVMYWYKFCHWCKVFHCGPLHRFGWNNFATSLAIKYIIFHFVSCFILNICSGQVLKKEWVN